METGQANPGSRERPLGVALHTRGRREPAAKVRWDKFRSGERSCRSPGRKTERAPAQAAVGLLGPRPSDPSVSGFSLLPVILALPRGVGSVEDFSAFRPWRSAVGEAKVQSQLFRQLTEEGLCCLVVPRTSTALEVREPQSYAGRSGRVGTIGPSACLSARGGGYRGRFSESGVV